MPKYRLAALAAVLALAAPAAAQPRPTDPALAPVPTDAFGFVSVRVSKLWDNPAAKPVRDWVASHKEPLDALLGVPPADLDRVTLVAPTVDNYDRDPLVLVTTRKPYNEARTLKALGVGENPRGQGAKAGGRVFEIDGPLGWVALVDDRTLLFVPKRLGDDAGPALVAQLVARRADGPLAPALLAAPAHDLTLGLDVRTIDDLVAEFGGDTDKRLTPFRVLLQAKSATLTADFDKTAKLKLVMAFPDAATAKRAAPVLEEGMKTLARELAPGPDGPRTNPSRRLVLDWAVSVLKNAKVTADGADVVAAADVPYADDLGKLAAALPKSLAVTRGNAKAMNNLKQLGLGLHNFHDALGQFPGDALGAGANPSALSWRVQILPYIGQIALFEQLDPSKAWDGPKNLKVLEAAEMPKVFEHPGRPAPKGHTYFRVFSFPKNAKGGDRPFFDEGQRGPRITSITDGTATTFMIVEAGEAVPWYKPDVLAYDGKLPLPQLGDKDADLFLAAFADGSVRSLRPSKLGEKTLRALITRAGGEVIPDIDR